jgi:hypothetical protein
LPRNPAEIARAYGTNVAALKTKPASHLPMPVKGTGTILKRAIPRFHPARMVRTAKGVC